MNIEKNPNQLFIEKYYSLLNSFDSAFSVLEIIYNDHGYPVDFRYLELNESFEKHTGIKNPTGKLVTEVMPHIENYWLQAYDRILQTGEPLRFENFNASTNRWYSAYSFRLGEPGSNIVAVIFDDITKQKVVLSPE